MIVLKRKVQEASLTEMTNRQETVLMNTVYAAVINTLETLQNAFEGKRLALEAGESIGSVLKRAVFAVDLQQALVSDVPKNEMKGIIDIYKSSFFKALQ